MTNITETERKVLLRKALRKLTRVSFLLERSRRRHEARMKQERK